MDQWWERCPCPHLQLSLIEHSNCPLSSVGRISDKYPLQKYSLARIAARLHYLSCMTSLQFRTTMIPEAAAMTAWTEDTSLKVTDQEKVTAVLCFLGQQCRWLETL